MTQRPQECPLLFKKQQQHCSQCRGQQTITIYEATTTTGAAE